MRSFSTVLVVAVLLGVVLADCPRECVCESGSDICLACRSGFHNIAEEGVFCCSDDCDQCMGTPDFCVSCPRGLVAVEGDCVSAFAAPEAEEGYDSAASSPVPPSEPSSEPSSSGKEEGTGLDTWVYIVIGVGAAVVLVALVLIIMFSVKKCGGGGGRSLGSSSSQHDVLFDDDDDVDLTPATSKKKGKNIDEDAFI